MFGNCLRLPQHNTAAHSCSDMPPFSIRGLEKACVLWFGHRFVDGTIIPDNIRNVEQLSDSSASPTVRDRVQMNEGYCKQERRELLLLRGFLSLPVALPENADVALIYIILIKHHRSLSISCVLTTTTEWLTRAQEQNHIRRKHTA